MGHSIYFTNRLCKHLNHPLCFSIVCMQAAPILIQASNGGNFDEMVDPRLEGKYDKDEMHRMVACAAACLRHVAKRRPKMSQVCITCFFI